VGEVVPPGEGASLIGMIAPLCTTGCGAYSAMAKCPAIPARIAPLRTSGLHRGAAQVLQTESVCCH
jgi:hypothetical protein